MARKPSKPKAAQRQPAPQKAVKKVTKKAAKAPQPHGLKALARRTKLRLRSAQQRWQAFRSQHVHLHKSFRRSYAEDYRRETHTPGLLNHAVLTFKTIFQHWRTFLPLVALLVVMYMLAVGLMSEEFYQQFQNAIDDTSVQLATGQVSNFARAALLLISTATTGGLSSGQTETQVVFGVLLLLVAWLVTLYLLRHFMAGERPRLRDGLYNALGPALSTLLILAVVFIQAIPLMLVIIAYSAANVTGFLETPFYALLFFVFAALMLTLSGYLLSSSLVALIAVTAPGLYPMQALFAASDLMAGRRIRFVIRLIYGILAIALLFVLVMLPVILIDLWLKSAFDWLAGWPIVPFCLLTLTCFALIYATTYLYLYYRWLLDNQTK